MRTAIIGGGAAGFFAAIRLKELVPAMDVTIFERSQRVLAKVEVSGGGRCNCTNSFAAVGDLSQVYPRGHRLLKRLFNVFGPADAYRWFERHGVPLTTQADECVFPQSQDAHTIINCFLAEVRRLGIHVVTGTKVDTLPTDFDYTMVTTGGQPKASGLQWLKDLGHKIEAPVPSLFTLSIDDSRLHALMGTVVEQASVQLCGTKLRAEGPLLITHWGMSGPAILRLSSYGARILADNDYRMPLAVNWVGMHEEEVREKLGRCQTDNRLKQVPNASPFGLPGRLWNYLTERALGEKAQSRWVDMGKKDMARLVNTLVNDTYPISGRAAFKDEFVTCGGVSLSSVNSNTLESRVCPHLYFAGEVLDIDGVTGGFNFQAAWTTATVAAQSIAKAYAFDER